MMRSVSATCIPSRFIVPLCLCASVASLNL